MLDAGDRACAMEVSSHALELGRAAGIHFACRVFTNLSQDHLDFHPTMEDYFLAKRRLFDEPGPAVVNLDDEYGRRLAAERDCIGFAVEREADYRARDVEFDVMGSRFPCETPDGALELSSPLPGLFNVQNVLAAVAAARALGVDVEHDPGALPSFDRVPGTVRDGRRGAGLRGARRLRPHARLARERAARRARDRPGAAARGVRRRRRPRPRQATADGRCRRPLADRVIVTSDNPRSEDPEAIVDEVLAGAGPDAEREVDRRRAIGRAIEDAAAGRRGRDRRQGPRAGPGVRGRPQGAVRRRDRRARSVASAAGGRMHRDRPCAARLECADDAAGARLAAGDPDAPGFVRALIDSREAGAGDLFVGLAGANVPTAARYAADVIRAGAWGVLVREPHAADAVEAGAGAAVVLAAEDPLAALQRLARAWRRELGAGVDRRDRLDRQDLDQGHPRRAAAHARGRRTPAARTSTPRSGCRCRCWRPRAASQALVLEMAMRGEGQIAELAAIAEPDVGVIVNVGPVHLELLGTVERVAAAKAELIRDLQARRRLRGAGQRAAARARTCATTSTPGPSAPAARCSCCPTTPAARRSRRAASGSSSSCPTASRTTCSTRSPPSPRRRALGVTPRRSRSTSASPRCAARSSSCPAG